MGGDSDPDNPFSPADLAGLSLADAFRQYVLHDEKLEALVSSLRSERGGFLHPIDVDHFEVGCYGLNGCGWGVTYRGWDIAEGIVGSLSPDKRRAEFSNQSWKRLGWLIGRLLDFLRSGELEAWATTRANPVTLHMIRKVEWSRNDVSVDFRNGDLLVHDIVEERGYQPVLSESAARTFRSIELRIPATASAAGDQNTVDGLGLKELIHRAIENEGIPNPYTHLADRSKTKKEFIDAIAMSSRKPRESVKTVLNEMLRKNEFEIKKQK